MKANYPTTRLIFDRKKTATKDKTALVQLEIMYARKRKYISTGVKVYKDQWTERAHVVDRPDMIALNRRIDETKARIDNYINGLIEKGQAFDFDTFDRWLNAEEERKTTFIDWVEERIEHRADIGESTRKTQRKIVSALRDFGKIVSFDELTTANIAKFGEWLRDKGIRQTTQWSYHKTLKTYIREAMRQELLDKDPYANIKIERGKSQWGRFLTPEEVARIEQTEMPTESISRVRDLFLMQCYTGLAYADLMAADFRKTEAIDGVRILRDERRKTGKDYTTVLTCKAVAILERYGYELPKISNVQYNLRLKVLADACGIDKPIASHYGRRTCGMLLLNDGFPIEIVAKVLGHANIKTTQEAYARILDKTVAEAFAKRRS